MVVLHGNGGCGFGEEGFKGKDESGWHWPTLCLILSSLMVFRVIHFLVYKSKFNTKYIFMDNILNFVIFVNIFLSFEK